MKLFNRYHPSKNGVQRGEALVVVGYKFEKAPQIYWAATSASLVSRPSSEDGVAVKNQPPSGPNPLRRVAEVLRCIGMLSECLYKSFLSEARHFCWRRSTKKMLTYFLFAINCVEVLKRGRHSP